MKTALVTGASGYIGGHVARKLLADGWSVVALVRSSSRLPDDLAKLVIPAVYDGTMASVLDTFEQHSIDVVVHLAAAVVGLHRADQVDLILDANVRLPVQLLEAMRQGKCRAIVNTGTFWQHGNSDGYSPVNFYAATKQAFEDIAHAYVEHDGVRLCTLVLFDTYGADDPRPKIVRLLVDAIDASEPLALSPGQQILDLVHVEDVASAFVVAVNRVMQATGAGSERFRVSGKRLSLKALVDLVSHLASNRLNVRLGARDYRDREIMSPVLNAVPPLPDWMPRRVLHDEIATMLRNRQHDR